MPLEALLTTAAFAPIADQGWLRVTGPDRLRWLNGMTTNNIAALQPGQGCYTFFLNAQGRILADATAFLLEDEILLETASPGTLATHLDHFIIMDDVELEVLSLEARSGLFIAGPTTLSVIANLGTSGGQAAPCAAPPPHPDLGILLKQTVYADASVWLIRAHSPLLPTFEIWSDPATLFAIETGLRTANIPQVSEADLHALRILSGTPLYGTDIRNTDSAKDLPQETNQARALNFSKGCYLGQEIVERIRSRGQVHRTLTGFTLTPTPLSFRGAAEEPASPLSFRGAAEEPVSSLSFRGAAEEPASPLSFRAEAEEPASRLFTAAATDKPIGELTSIASTPFGTFALGYIRREVLDRGDSIQYPGGIATPSALPFPIPLKRDA